MKLATFEHDGKEAWGVVMNNPAENRLWIYEPAKVDRQLQNSATATNGYSVSMPTFMANCEWPETLTGFLALEDAGMAVLEKLIKFFTRFLAQGDEARMMFAGYPLEDVSLKSPIPMPRLMWGLVQNCPTFIRSNPQRQSTNLFPMGHQRPCGAICGDGQIFYQPANTGALGYNVELGVVIGKKGRYIPINRAMEYVAGYTVVIDSQVNGLPKLMYSENLNNYDVAEKYDWYVGATCSWGGKMADAHCTVGPWITTRDEIGNPYDLLVWTKMAGKNRDRAHTSALLLGVERVIQWYSSFATLYPGDILHLGTIGTDGLRLMEDECYSGPECTVDSEIESVGYVKSPVLNMRFGDWRSDDDVTKTIHISSAVRDVIKSGKAEIASVSDWHLPDARHFWTIFKNYKRVTEKEGIRLLKTPRFLAAPNSALGLSGSVVELPPRANNLELSVELAVVMKKLAKEVKQGEADSYILGYTTLISITDSSFDDVLIEPTTNQEKGLPLVYGRWADGFNSINPDIKALSWREVLGRKMTLSADGIGSVCGNTDEYYSSINDTLSFITTYITVFPGDVLTLGHIAERIKIPAEKITDGMKISAEIEGLGAVNITLKHSESADNSVVVNQLKL